MEDVKWLLKKWGFLILMLLIAGVICWGKLHTEGGRGSMGASGGNRGQ